MSDVYWSEYDAGQLAVFLACLRPRDLDVLRIAFHPEATDGAGMSEVAAMLCRALEPKGVAGSKSGISRMGGVPLTRGLAAD